MHNIFNIKSEFTRNVLTLLTGTTLAQAIPIAITPILTRIYTPEDFGVLGVFMALCTIFGVIATGRYELAIMNPESNIDAKNIAFLGLLISFCLSLFLLIVILLFNEPIVEHLGESSLNEWLYLVPFVVLLTGIYNTFNYLNVRDKNFKNIAFSNGYKSFSVASTQIAIGTTYTGPFGLLSGYIAGQFIFAIKQATPNLNYQFFKVINKETVKKVAKRYKDYPRYSSFSALSNVASQQLPVILLGYFYTASIAGFFSVASRILILPVSLVGTAFGQVFFQRTSSCKSIDEISSITQSTIKKLVVIGVLPFTLILVFGDIIIAFFLGEEWRIAGIYMQQFSLWLYFVFITSPLTNLYATLEKQKEALYFNLILLIIRISSIVFGYIILTNSSDVVTVFAISGALSWITWYGYTVKLVGLNVVKFVSLTIAPFMAIGILLYLGRYQYGI